MSLLSHDRYHYDSLILSEQTWAYPRQHLQQLLRCVVSVRLNLPEAEERKLCPLRYYANCVSTMLTVLILHNVESVYFFYSNPVFLFFFYYYYNYYFCFEHLILVFLSFLALQYTQPPNSCLPELPSLTVHTARWSNQLVTMWNDLTYEVWHKKKGRETVPAILSI